MWNLFFGIIFLILGVAGLIINKNIERATEFGRPPIIGFQGFCIICILVGLLILNQYFKLISAFVIK